MWIESVAMADHLKLLFWAYGLVFVESLLVLEVQDEFDIQHVVPILMSK